MSKIGIALKMIILLKTKGKMSIKQLSDKLEVKERQIRNYKDYLEQAGITIQSTTGINGGYEIVGYDYLNNLTIEESEYVALGLAKTQLDSMDFVYINDLKNLYEKLTLVKNKKKLQEQDNILFKGIRSIECENEKVMDINLNIISKKKLKILYYSLKSDEKKERVIHPYSLINYKGAYYLIAYCERRQDVLDFKLSRIISYDSLKEHFQIIDNFNLKEYVNSFGIYKDEKIKLKLKIKMPMAYIISEKVWVENQKITWNKDRTITFEAETKGKTELISWILSMGSDVTVVEPESLKEEIRKRVSEMYKQNG